MPTNLKYIKHKAYYEAYRKKRVKWHKRYMRRYYKKNRAAMLEVNKTYRDALHKVMREAKAVPCADCGQQFHHSAMDFDHVRGVKRNCVARLNVSMNNFLAEIAKCEVVCANCHRIRAWRRKHNVPLPNY